MASTKFVAIGEQLMTWDGFLDHLRQMLLDRAGTWAGVAEQAKVTYRWIRTFIHAEKADVTPSRVIRLAQALGLTVTVHIGEALVAEARRRNYPAGRARKTH